MRWWLTFPAAAISISGNNSCMDTKIKEMHFPQKNTKLQNALFDNMCTCTLTLCAVLTFRSYTIQHYTCTRYIKSSCKIKWLKKFTHSINTFHNFQCSKGCVWVLFKHIQNLFFSLQTVVDKILNFLRWFWNNWSMCRVNNWRIQIIHFFQRLHVGMQIFKYLQIDAKFISFKQGSDIKFFVSESFKCLVYTY